MGTIQNVGRRAMKVPTETFDNSVLADSRRRYPSVECLTPVELKDLERRIARLMDFEEEARIPYQVADYLEKWLTGKPGFEKRDIIGSYATARKKKYYFRDPWEGNSMTIVKEGERPITDGFNLILCHSDSSCLRIKSKPVKLEWDVDKQYHHLGVRFSVVEHGGLLIHQWPSQQVRVMGYVLDKKGKKVYVDVPGSIPDISAHVENRQDQEVREAFEREKTLEIILGHTSVAETLERFGLTSMDDFGNSKLFVVPNNKPMPIDDYTWRLLLSYGHDDRSCVFSAVDALVKAREPTLTSIVWITDNEEAGDVPPSGANGSFFDLVLDQLCEKHYAKKRQRLFESDRRRLCLRSSFLFGDVAVAPYGHDAEDMDITNAAKLGFGVYISGEDEEVSSKLFVRKLRDTALRGKERSYNLPHQVVGGFYLQDRFQRGFLTSYAQHFARRIGQWGWVGIPCASTHSPNEIICPGDEYATFRFYRRFFESNTGIGFDGKAHGKKPR